MKRRDFIALFGGAVAWPLAARAQQGERVRRIGVLIPGDENGPLRKTGVSAFIQALAGLGWTDGRNLRMDLRGRRGDINRIRALARELIGLQPDIILASSTPATAAVQRFARRAGSGQAPGVRTHRLGPCYSASPAPAWKRLQGRRPEGQGAANSDWQVWRRQPAGRPRHTFVKGGSRPLVGAGALCAPGVSGALRFWKIGRTNPQFAVVGAAR